MRSLQYIMLTLQVNFEENIFILYVKVYTLFLLTWKIKKSIITNVKWSLAPGLEKNLEKNRIRFFFQTGSNRPAATKNYTFLQS